MQVRVNGYIVQKDVYWSYVFLNRIFLQQRLYHSLYGKDLNSVLFRGILKKMSLKGNY